MREKKILIVTDDAGESFLSAPSGLAGPGCDAALRTSIGCANAVSAAQETGPSPACDARVGEVPS